MPIRCSPLRYQPLISSPCAAQKHKNINKDGFWFAEIVSCSSTTHAFRGEFVHEGRYGYLSADQLPLLVFHGFLAMVYVLW
jgi:hypothetical protein